MRAAAILFFVCVAFVSEAYAYVDPGTGATYIGSLAPLFIGIAVALLALLLKFFWKPIMHCFFKKDEDQEDS